ncbi:MAG: YfhO family protein, partial [Anaerolineae bacterium]|nr:YfhO family protein [Anaerolineae bacterium]
RSWLMRRILIILCISAAFVVLLSPILDFPQLPTLIVWVLLACVGFGLVLIGLSRWGGRLVFRLMVGLLLVGELFAASRGLAYNNPTAPEAFSFLRTAPAHLLTDQSLYRFISMSGIVYDPGDLKEIQQIFEGQLPPKAIYDYVVAAKRKEILAPNLPLLYKIASVDGYDGGLLPLKRYITLLRLFLSEEDILPDGRLREQLRQVPEGRLLSLLNVKYVITDKVFDVWIDGVYYDLEHTATLGRGTTPEVAVQDLPEFAATSLGLVSYLEGAEELADGTPVVEVVVSDTEGRTQCHILRAGLDTAEGDYDAVAASRPIQHAKARIGHHWRDHPGGNDYIALVDLGEATTSKEITLRYLSEAGRFHLRGLSLIDERTGTSESVVVSSAGHFRLVHSGDVKIYQNLDVLPRAFLVHRARVIEDDEAAVAAMRDESFRPNEEAILAEAPPGWVASVSPQATLNPDQVTMVSYEPERVIIEADLASGGYLILTDTYYPGWWARVDGKESSIIRANLLFRAISLSAGQHRVEFYYEPTSLRTGVAISSATLLVIVVGLWWWLVRRR